MANIIIQNKIQQTSISNYIDQLALNNHWIYWKA